MTMSKVSVAQLNNEGWKSWQIALAIGVPAVVVGAYAYRKYSKKSNLIAEISEGKVQNGVSAQTYKKRGNKHFMAGQYAEAIECYSKAIELGSEVKAEELSTFHQNRAAAEEHMENYLQVIADCTRALELNPKYVKALTRRAKAYRTTGFLTECIHDITLACTMDMTNPANLALADEVMKEYGQKKAVENLKNRSVHVLSPTYVWTVLGSFSQDPVFKYKKAEFEAKESTKIEDAIESPFKKALREFYSNDFSNTVRLCTEEMNLEDSEQKLEALFMRATYYYLSGQLDLAVKDFQTILDKENVDSKIVANTLVKLAKLKMQRDMTDEALKHLQKAEEIDPCNPDIYMHRGQLYLINDKLDEAITDFEKSISLNDNMLTAHIHKCLAEIKVQRGFHPLTKEDIEGAFEDLVEKFPLCSDVYSFYGQSLSEIGEFREGEEYLDKAISLDPKDPTPYVHKALSVLGKCHDTQECCQLMDKALEIDKNCSFALQALGSIELQRGNEDRALEMFKRAIDSSTNEAEMVHLYCLLISADFQKMFCGKVEAGPN